MKEMQKNKKELENIFAKLNIKLSKDNLPSSSVSSKPLHSQKELNYHISNSPIPQNNTQEKDSQFLLKGSYLQESSNSMNGDHEDIKKILKEKVMVKSMSNDLRVIKETSNVDDDMAEEKGHQLIEKLKENIRHNTDDGQFVYQSQPEKKSNNNNENMSCMSKEKTSYHTTGNKIYNLNSKYDNYDIQKLAYQAYKNLSKCQSNAPSFLKRMNFYSIKSQTKNELINLLVEKAKPKIQEKEKVITFNRLIQDSNRRAEARNRVELLSSNHRIANDFYETETNLIKEPSKKITQKKWEKVYERFTDFERERKLSIREKYEAKMRKSKEEEQRIVDDMKKYEKRASRETIDSISHRMYQEAMVRQLRSAGSSPRMHSYKNLRSDTEISLGKPAINKSMLYKHKKNNISSDDHRLWRRIDTDNNHSSMNANKTNKQSNQRRRQMMTYAYQTTRKRNNNTKKDKSFIPHLGAERIVNGFFQQNYLKTYYH